MRSAAVAFWDTFRYRELLVHLAHVQFKNRYKNAMLGIGWSLATPVALFIVFAFVFQPIFEIKVENYSIWLMAALFPWSFFQAAVSETIRTLQANATFIKANPFPREVLPLSGVLVQLVNLLMSLVFVIVYVGLTLGLTPKVAALPLVLLIWVLFSSGLSLLLSSLDAVYKDVRYLVDVTLLGWFFLTPIFYPLARIQDKMGGKLMGSVVLYNPMTGICEGFRYCLLPEQGSLDGLWYPAILAVLVFVFGLAQFRRLVTKYVDIL